MSRLQKLIDVNGKWIADAIEILREEPVSVALDSLGFELYDIKQFMATNGIIDIKMRMLNIEELLKIQGFPDDYTMVGTQADCKKFIGNSVVPLVVKCWIEALHNNTLLNEKKIA